VCSATAPTMTEQRKDRPGAPLRTHKDHLGVSTEVADNHEPNG